MALTGIRPMCAECDKTIAEDTAFYIDGEGRCEGCMETYRREVHDE